MIALVNTLGCSSARGASTRTSKANFLYCVLGGGDFMCMGRFLVPAVPHMALILAAWVERQGDRRPDGRVTFDSARSRLALIVALLLAGSSLPAAWDRHLTPESLRSRFHFRWNAPDYVSEYGQWSDMGDRLRHWTLLGQALALHTRPGESLVATTVGAKGFYSDLFLYDPNGLVLPRGDPRASSPGAQTVWEIQSSQSPAGLLQRRHVQPHHALARERGHVGGRAVRDRPGRRSRDCPDDWHPQDEPVCDSAGPCQADGTIIDGTAKLRAKRNPTGNGRVYTVSFSADDGKNGQCTGEVKVSVPKNRGKNGIALDEGPLYDSAVP